MNKIETVDNIAKLATSGFSDWQELGYVNVKESGDLLLFNYSAKAVYEKRWNYFEIVSRGLIINRVTGEIVARPFDKFFNWDEHGRKTTSPIKTITEKMDGSLGIFYYIDGEYKIATRGSFDGEQAAWATQHLNNGDYRLHYISKKFTLLFEIIYPKNRIVLDYGKREDLVLLAIRDRFTGEYLPHNQVVDCAGLYGFSVPNVYSFDDIEALIDDTGNLGVDAEGYVVEFDDGQRFKFKGQCYFKLHRIISSLTFKNVLIQVQNGTIDDFLEFVPDEFLDDVHGWIKYINLEVLKIGAMTNAAFQHAPKADRKEFAQYAMSRHKGLAPYLFAMLDGRDIEPLIYKHHEWEYEMQLRGGG